VARPRHPSKEIEFVIAYAEDLGWTVEISNGHAWGRLFCPHHTREGCIISIWSTPRSCQNHAKAIRRSVERCGHKLEEDGGEEL
jgi:hypothetical protein